MRITVDDADVTVTNQGATITGGTVTIETGPTTPPNSINAENQAWSVYHGDLPGGISGGVEYNARRAAFSAGWRARGLA